MKKSILYNATIPPKVFYGLHMVEGVAEYRELGQDPERIFIGEQAIKNMDPSFAGRPVYVQHVESVNLEKLQEEADGYVMESFYNELDGKHWCKFIVVSDKAHQAIASGWKLSNAYIPKEQSGGGLWHGVEYAKEVMRGEYEHLAIVNNPRYQESIILSPEEFKDYNERKQEELKRLTNEQGDSPMKLNFFKRSKVENSSDLENTVVVLPKSGKEFSISDLVTNADISEMQKKEPQMCNGDHMVKVGEDTMSVNDLVSKHMALKDSKKNEDDENLKEEADKQKKNDEDDGDADDKKENEDGAEEMKKEGEDQKKINEEKEEEKAKKNARFETFKNAHKNAPAEARTVEISMDRTARGKSRYGS